MPHPTGQLISGPVTNGSASAKFGTHIDYLGHGGYRSVATLDERDAIWTKSSIEFDGQGSGMRRHLMLVGVEETNAIYLLFVNAYAAMSSADRVTALKDNANWIDLRDFLGRIDESNLVHKTGNENIAGNKNFTTAVGIGTATPGARFDIVESSNASTARIANFFAPNAGGAAIAIGRGNSTNNTAVAGFDANGAYLCVLGRPATDFQVNAAGQVRAGGDLFAAGSAYIGNGSDGSGLKIMASDGSGNYIRCFDLTNTGTSNSINFGAVGAGGDLRAHGQSHRWFNPGGNQQLMVLEGNGQLTLTYGVRFPDGSLQTTAAVSPTGADLYNVPTSIREFVVQGSYNASSELNLTGIPAGSVPGMKFSYQYYLYEYMPGDAGSLTWIRSLK